MADILKTWPVVVSAKTTANIFGPRPRFDVCYFALGKGKPKQAIEGLWFTYQGRILGRFNVSGVIQNDGTLPPLRRLDGGESAWEMKKDVYLAICPGPCERLRERIYHSGFRGWRYFDLASYRPSMEARMRL